MTTPAQLLPHVDELVMEYLLFRGFTKSFQALAAERKRDRTKNFDVEQIISQLLTFVQTYRIEPILDTWKFLEARFFSRLDASYVATIRQLEDSWLRLYVVNAIKTGQRDKAIDFFKLLADKLNANASTSNSDSWHRWFILPYVQNPESDPYFRGFFTKQWLESFVTSFRNFLSLIFRNLPLPKLLAFQISRLEEPSIKLRLKTTQSECNRLRSSTAQSADRIRKLEDAGHQLYGIVQTMVQHTLAEHFVSAEGASTSSKSSSSTLQMLATLSEQLKALSQVFGPATVQRTSQIDTELEAALLNPLPVTLNAAKPHGAGDQDQDADSSLYKPTGSQVSSSAASTSFEPALVETIALSDDHTAHGEGICAYADDGSRLSVSRIGQQQITIFDVNPDGSSALSDRIRTESGVVAVDWVAKSESILFALQDGTINVWDTEAKVRTFIISHSSDERKPTHVACARSKAIGAIVLAGLSPSTSADAVLPTRVQFFAVEDHAMRVLSSVELDNGFSVAALRWSDDASLLAVSSSDGRVSFLRPSNSRVLSTWQVPGDTSDVTGLELSSLGQSILIVSKQASEADHPSERRVFEWSVRDTMENSDAAPVTSYSLPKELATGGGATGVSVQIKALGESFVVATHHESSDGEGSALVLLTRGHAKPTSTVVHVSSRIDSVAWHPEGHFISAVTNAGELMTWKVGE